MSDALIALNQTLHGKFVANVLGWSNVTEDANDLQTFADNIRSDYDNFLVSHLVNDWSLDNITVSFIDVDHISHSVTIPFTLGPLVGNDVGDSVATQSALLISTTRVGPRPNRGRIYFAGLPETAMTNSAWVFSIADDFRNVVQDWATSGVNAGNQVFFLRIIRRPGGPFTEYESAPVTSALVRTFPATQRRRRLSA